MRRNYNYVEQKTQSREELWPQSCLWWREHTHLYAHPHLLLHIGYGGAVYLRRKGIWTRAPQPPWAPMWNGRARIVSNTRTLQGGNQGWSISGANNLRVCHNGVKRPCGSGLQTRSPSLGAERSHNETSGSGQESARTKQELEQADRIHLDLTSCRHEDFWQHQADKGDLRNERPHSESQPALFPPLQVPKSHLHHHTPRLRLEDKSEEEENLKDVSIYLKETGSPLF